VKGTSGENVRKIDGNWREKNLESTEVAAGIRLGLKLLEFGFFLSLFCLETYSDESGFDVSSTKRLQWNSSSIKRCCSKIHDSPDTYCKCF
jgi:hypothetical protein